MNKYNRKDAPEWNNRKPMEQDYYPHETDKAISRFRDYVNSFEYTPEPKGPKAAKPEPLKLKVAQG